MDQSQFEQLRKYESISRKLETSDFQRDLLQKETLKCVNSFMKKIDDVPTYSKTEKEKLPFLPLGPSYSLDKLFTHLEENIMAPGINPVKGDLSYIPLGGLYTSALGDFLTGIFNKVPAHYFSAPGQVNLEHGLLRWAADLVGFPSSMLGNMTSGGSVANLVSVITARDHFLAKGGNLNRATIYLTVHAHSCIIKAISMTGLNICKIRFIEVDSSFRMKTEDLESQIEEDLSNDLEPFFVIGTCGSTDTGTIDPLDKIAQISQKYNLWFHCDGAYGGFFVLVDEVKEKMKGIEKADSLVLDPHKTLFTTFGCSMVLIRNGKLLANSFYIKPSYFVHDTDDDEIGINPSDLSPEMSRPFRGLKLWLPLAIHGLEPFQACLREKIMLTQYFHTEIKKIGFQVIDDKPDLTVCIHRFVPKSQDANYFNKNLLEVIRKDGRIYLSSTMINGVFWIRCAILQYRTHLSTIQLYLSLLKYELDPYRRG